MKKNRQTNQILNLLKHFSAHKAKKLSLFLFLFCTLPLQANDKLKFAVYPTQDNNLVECNSFFKNEVNFSVDGFVSGTVSEIYIFPSKRGQSKIALNIGGIWYHSNKINFSSFDQINFKANNIGSLTLTFNENKSSATRNQFSQFLEDLFGPKSSPAHFIPKNAHYNLRVNGFTCSKDFAINHDFLQNNVHEIGNYNFLLSYSATKRQFTVLKLDLNSSAPFENIYIAPLSDIFESSEDNDDDIEGYEYAQLRQIYSDEIFGTMRLGPDFNPDEDIPQVMFQILPE